MINEGKSHKTTSSSKPGHSEEQGQRLREGRTLGRNFSPARDGRRVQKHFSYPALEGLHCAVLYSSKESQSKHQANT